MPAPDLADRILGAHVRFAVGLLTGSGRDDVVAETVDDLLAIGEHVTLGQVLDVDEVVRVVVRVLSTVPPSPAATTLSQGCADVLHDGPSQPFTAADVIGREDVERIVDELIQARPLIKKVLDEVVESPMIASVVSRFVSRVVGDVLGTNRAAASKVPGVGGLLGTASKVVGAGASGVEQLLGSTAGKGAQIAARRLNKLAVDTLKDPQLKDGLLQLWDERSGARIDGLSRIASLDDLHRAVALVHDVAVGAFGSAPAADLAERLVRMLFATYGDTPVTSLIDELGVTRDDLVVDAQSATAQLIEATVADGRLETFVRARLEPFYRSEEFATATGSLSEA